MTNGRDIALLPQLNTFFSGIFAAQGTVNPQLTIAFSGGLDSCVLLHLCAQLQHQTGFRLSAHHVHHGISKNADTWADFCQTVCNQLNIPLTVSAVKVDRQSPLGIEAAARKARYEALLAQRVDFLCTAHHQDDQAETLLLQLARGAGVKGLAAMSSFDVKKQLLRPLLHVSRENLQAYAQAHQLSWVEDESNVDTRFDRNFMRHSILPVLAQRYPSIQQNLARSAAHLAEANDLLNDLATQDARLCLDDKQDVARLFLLPLKVLSQARIHNVIRWWLAKNAVRMPSSNQLQQIVEQLLNAKSDANIQLKLTAEMDDSAAQSADLTLRYYQHYAYLVHENTQNIAVNQVWNNEEFVYFSDNSYLSFEQKVGEGIAIRHLNHQALMIKNRSGGERFKADLKRPSRSLKVVLQMSHLPPWQRASLPLIYWGDTLAIIPNIGVDAHLQAQADEMGLLVSWHPK